jgi:hypothetical protein
MSAWLPAGKSGLDMLRARVKAGGALEELGEGDMGTGGQGPQLCAWAKETQAQENLLPLPLCFPPLCFLPLYPLPTALLAALSGWSSDDSLILLPLLHPCPHPPPPPWPPLCCLCWWYEHHAPPEE